MIDRRQDQSQTSRAAPGSGDLPCHIMVVDDEKPIVEMLRLLLEDEGFQVSSETSAADALRSVKRRQPDLIITDVMMPGMTGYELARAVMSIDPGVHIIFMSAVVDGRHNGNHPFLAKPFDLTTVIETVESQLRAS